MTNIFPIDFEEKNTIANNDFILFSDSEDWNKLKKAQYSNLKWEQGDPWTPWADWAAATISVGSTTTWEPWTNASVTNSWTSSAAVFNFTIPKGAKGDDGDDWAAATITVWTTTTLPAWSSATVTNSWTSQDAILNFGIPKGDSWTGSWDVNWPASSTDWDIVLFDWATWKLIKDSSKKLSDYQTALTTQTAYSSKWTSTKVATITTNTLWQVTAVSETSIAFPVSSVNTQTWAVVLDADDISDSTTTNKFVTSAEKSTWSWKQDQHSDITVTLAAASWSSKSITVSATWVTASNTVIVSPIPSDLWDYADWGVYCSAQWSGTLTFGCDTEPTNDIDVNVVIFN